MTRTKALWAALYSTVATLCMLPTIALAQRAAQPSSAPAPASDPARGTGDGSSWLWIIAAIVAVAIIWWAMSSRRRTMTRRA